MRRALMLMLMPVLLATATGSPAQTATHPSQLPALELDAHFPRCTEAQLQSAGFPDHKHAYWWPDWEVLKDADGVTYGPGAFCYRRQVQPRENLIIEPGRLAWGHFETRQNAEYEACDFLLLLETLDWAARSLESMLGLAPRDTLRVISPDNIPDYREATGQDIWRLYKLDGDTAIIEPYGTLQARTLDGHAVFALVTDWLLREGLPTPLPPWLHYGMAEYFSENGVHLVNYMLQFREDGSPLMSPAIIDFILSSGPDPDLEADRERYRRASYSAFLMVWELVENRGGVKQLRSFLTLVREGVEPDRAAKKIYGMDMAELARSLDPVELGEPIGEAVQSRRPAQPPR